MNFLFESSYFHGNVRFNFRGRAINDLSPFAAGYHTAGKVLVRKMESAAGYRDYEGYPILFLYRHALELYLKAIVYRGSQLHLLILDKELDTQKFLTKHKLTVLLPPIEAIFRALKWKWEFRVSGAESFDDFAALVKEIEAIDPLSYCFRYPIDSKGKAALQKHFVVNAITFGKKMDPVLDLLSGVVFALEEYWDATAEVMYRAQGRAKKHSL